MHKTLLILACLALAAILAAPAARAEGLLVEGSVTVAAGATTASGDVTLNLSASREAGEIDHLTVVNASGGGTGTVSFAAYDAGVSVALASTNSLIPAATAALWPKRVWTYSAGGGTATNAEPYLVRTLRVSVTLSGTNSLATVFNVGALVR